jgi:hypothetical protein
MKISLNDYRHPHHTEKYNTFVIDQINDFVLLYLTRPGYRVIHTQRIKQAEEFRTTLAQLFTYHKLDERLSSIISEMEDGCTPESIQRFEALDAEKGELIAAALKQHSSFTTTTAWSRPLARAGLQVRYWAERMKALQHNYVITDSWKRKGIDLGIRYIDSLTKDDMKQRHRDALRYYKSLKSKAIPLRDQYLEDLANHYAKGDEKKKAQRLRTLRKKEKLRQINLHITGLFRGDRQPLSALIIPDGDIMRRTTDPVEINSTLLAINKQQLQASSSSPFVSGPLSIIGFDGFTDAAGDILSGDLANIPRTSVETQAILSNLATVCPTMDLDLSSDKENAKRFHKAITVTPEKTSSSPSGLNYSIYKVAIQDSYITSVLSKLALTPFRYGFTLDRWKNVTQVMIKKKAEPIFDKLRIIELFEGDYVAVVKSFMRELMGHLMDHNETDIGTFATEKGGNTHMAILSRVWAYDIARVCRDPIVTLDNDSMGCYDRMVPGLLSLFLRRVGFPDNITTTFITQLLQRQRRVQTCRRPLAYPIS